MQWQLHPVRCSAVVYWERSLVIIKSNTPRLAFVRSACTCQHSPVLYTPSAQLTFLQVGSRAAVPFLAPRNARIAV